MRTKTKVKTFLFAIIAFIIGLVGGTSSYVLAFSPESDTLFSIAKGDLSIHFLELGNKYAGDCIYIKANDQDILIDAGSRQSSATTIINYVNKYCTDGTLEYLIATHAHQDHIAAFPSTNDRQGIFDAYTVKNIIDFGEASKFGDVGGNNTPSGVYTKYCQARNNEIAEENANYIAVSDWETKDNPEITTVFQLGDGITMQILYNHYYTNKATDENDYSVCLLLTQGSTNVLLTGDLEAEGEEKLIQNNNLPECALYKAGHHGSKSSSSEDLLNAIKPKNVVFTCVAGATEYTTNLDNVFPTKEALTRIANHTSNCYVTSVCTNTPTELANKNYSKFESMNGDIIFTSNKNGYSINCTNNNILLKDTDWCKEFRPNIQWVA
ncbi:MAG: MBL fold metallo-hydrolase [Clostridia bacterium]|nr:MBL fold metallo-hydrolase [Clostridia bacterium]